MEKESAAVKQAKAADLKHIRGSRGLWSKTGEKPATHSTKDGKFVALTGTQPKKPRGQRAATRTSPAQTPISTPEPAQRMGTRDVTGGYIDRVSAELNKRLLDIASRLVDMRSRGKAGAGGAAASQGESLFTVFGSSLATNKGFSGLLAQAKDPNHPDRVDNFESLVTKHAANELDKNNPFVSDKKKLTQRRNIRETIARDFGLTNYDDTDPAQREKIAEYLALREVYVQTKLSEAKTACENKQDHVFCKGGKAGFGKNDAAYTSWLEAAFDGSVRLDSLIRSGNTRLDPKRGWTVLQSDNSDEAISGGYSPDAMVLDTLKQLRDSANTDEDRAHYDYQIGLFKDLGFHDTFVVGYDKNNRLTVLHDSNKKSSDLDDPHNNTTPDARLQALVDQYSKERDRNNPETFEAAKEMVDILDNALTEVRAIKKSSTLAASKIPITPDMVKLAESPFMQEYMVKVDTMATGKPNKGTFAAWLRDNNKDWTNADTATRLQLMQDYMKINPEDTYSTFGYVFVKMGEHTGEGKIMQAVFGSKEAPKGLTDVRQIKTVEQSKVSDTYTEVINALQTRDTADGHTPPPANGRHVQAYVDSVMHALHFDKYVRNYDGDMVMSIGRHAVTPQEVRETLMDILPKEFTKTINIETSDGRTKLENYIRENCRVDAASGALILSTPNGECSIAEDTWRTAGKTAKVATSFGSCFRDALRRRTSAKPVDFLQ